jgi:hypothetical protein
MMDTYIESLPTNRFIIRVLRANGSVFLTNCFRCFVDEQQQLVIERHFEVTHKDGTRDMSPYIALRVLAKGAWVEWEDVTDRIKVADAKEVMNDEDSRRDGGDIEVPSELVPPVQGVGE